MWSDHKGPVCVAGLWVTPGFGENLLEEVTLVLEPEI